MEWQGDGQLVKVSPEDFRRVASLMATGDREPSVGLYLEDE